MLQYTKQFPWFYAYNFNMLDYDTHSFRNGMVLNTPDTLETVRVRDLIPKYKACACIINSDVYDGPGKHWMAIFVDFRDPKSCSAEFFNSSGNAPVPEWLRYLHRARTDLEAHKCSAKVVRVSKIRHQDSRSECGVYSLFYVFARLKGVPFAAFSQKVPDRYMFEFRQHIFDGSSFIGRKFDWPEYQSKTKIIWE